MNRHFGKLGDVLVHIDPFDPHERLTPDSKTPVELAGYLARKEYRVVYWYAYDSIEERGWTLQPLQKLPRMFPSGVERH